MEISDVAVFEVPDSGGTALVVVVDTDQGVCGIGEAGVRSRPDAIKGAVADLRPFLVGADPLRSEHLWQLMFRGGFFPGDRIMGAAIAAVDIALWDIKGRALGVPVHQLLGGAVRERVTCYTHVGPENGDTARSWPTAARRSRRAGSTWGSSSPTRASWSRGGRRAPPWSRCWPCATRSGTPWSSARRAHAAGPARRGDALPRAGAHRPFFIEDPLRSEAPDAYATFRPRTGVPLAAGEQYASKWEFRALLDRDLIDYCRADICIAGGFTELRKIAGWCEAHHVLMATHNPLGVVARPPAALNLACANFGLRAGARQTRPRFFDGVPGSPTARSCRPTRPGLGIEFDRDAALAASPSRHRLPIRRRADGAFTNW